jgi:RNA polymerase sigma-70 factor (ECF subfamily)
MTPSAAPDRPDADIVQAIEAGELARAFARVMDRYEGKVFRLCVAYLADHALAADTAQDSLVRIWKALPRYDGRAALSTFIYAITRNRCLTALGRRPAPLSLDEPAVAVQVDRMAGGDAQSARDQGATLRRLVDDLPEVTRRVVVLYYFEEESVAEVADLTGLPEGTIKTHLFRARASLLARFEALGLADPALWSH